jgi:divalent metal cation (Fe/Co/Zn/Cd) transporter
MIFKWKSYSKQQLYSIGMILAGITVFYNIAEGIISMYFGVSDETLALFGFGADSFVEVISGIGIAHMIYRIRKKGEEQRDSFEKTALRITGVSFYILATGLLAGSVLAIYQGHQPKTTFWGVVISSISIATMGILIYLKKQVGRELDSRPILSDAACTKTCLYLSVLLLISSLGYELFSIPYIDSIGSLGIMVFAVKEGREAFDKAKGKVCSSCSGSCSL